MTNKQILEKVYTRDTSAIIQQGWYCGVMEMMKELGWESSDATIMHYLNDGVVEVWENDDSINWLIENIYIKKI